MTGCTPAVFAALGCGWWPYFIVGTMIFFAACFVAAFRSGGQ